jgi:hypothetical protein
LSSNRDRWTRYIHDYVCVLHLACELWKLNA